MTDSARITPGECPAGRLRHPGHCNRRLQHPHCRSSCRLTTQPRWAWASTTVGLIFLVARLWGAGEAIGLVGWASDRTRTSFGRRRKPWILAGGALFIVASLAVFFPPPSAGPAWLAIGLLVLCLGWTATSTPLYAWGGELSADPRERARVQAYIQTAASIGIFLVLLLPAVLDGLRIGGPALRVQAMGLLVIAALVAGLLLIGTRLHERPPAAAPAAAAGWSAQLKALGTRHTAVANHRLGFLRHARRGCARRGVRVLRHPLHAPGHRQRAATPAIRLRHLCLTAVGTPELSLRPRAHSHYRRAGAGGDRFALLLVTPQRVWLLVALSVAQGLAQGSGNLMLRAMVYDVADRHRISTGAERAGLFSSIFNVTTNAAMAIRSPLHSWRLPVSASVLQDPTLHRR